MEITKAPNSASASAHYRVGGRNIIITFNSDNVDGSKHLEMIQVYDAFSMKHYSLTVAELLGATGWTVGELDK